MNFFRSVQVSRGCGPALAALLAALLAPVALRAETVVSSGAAAGGFVQKTDPYRIVTSGTVEIASGGRAVFLSGNTVSLQPGFKATAGSFFQAAVSRANGVPLAWPAVSGATRYDIYRNGSKIGEATGTSYIDTTASASTAYNYVIKSITGGVATDLLTLSTIMPFGFELFTPLLPSS